MGMTRGSFLRALLVTPFVPGFIKETAAEELHKTDWRPSPAMGNELMKINWMAPAYNEEIFYEHAGPVDSIEFIRPGVVRATKDFDIWMVMDVNSSILCVDIFGEEIERVRYLTQTFHMASGDTLHVTHDISLEGWTDVSR